MIQRTTIPQLLKDAAGADAGELVFHLEGGARRIPASELWEASCRRAELLFEKGVRPGSHVGLVGPNNPQWTAWAFGIWAAGATVVPLQHPLGIRDKEVVEKQLRRLAERARCHTVLSDERFKDAFGKSPVISWDESLPGVASNLDVSAIRPDDVAVIQFTSGSTGDHKGVVLEHGRILYALHQTAIGLGVTPTDRFLGWAPLYHDLGLFGYLVRPLVAGCEGNILPTERFARDPGEWFRTLSKTRATLTTAPSSGYAVALKHAGRDPHGIDLSELRSAIFGAEMTAPDVVDRLRTEGPRYGLSPAALAGSYGMAEATLTISLQPGGMRTETKEIDQLAGGRGSGGGPTRRICSCGPPVPETRVRITSRNGEQVPDGIVGEIEVQARGLMRGYLDVEPSSTFREDGWFPTGDLGYLSRGEVFVTGRIKDIVIAMGANYAPEDIEWAAEGVGGVRKGRAVAFGRTDRDGEIVVALEARDGADVDRLPTQVARAISSSVGLAPKEVVVLPKGAIPKTTSGKLKRSTVRDAYERGELGSVDRRG